MEMDFSEYHSTGDHWPGDRRCRTMYGGWRRHLYLAWRFHRRDQAIGFFRRPLLCRFGRHRRQVWYGKRPGKKSTVHPVCPDCWKSQLPSEHDIDNEPRFPGWMD